MGREPKKYEDDDGRVVANMDVEGMRHHDKRVRHLEYPPQIFPKGEPMTKSEARRYTWYAVLAGLTIVLVFGVSWVLLIWLLTLIW